MNSPSIFNDKTRGKRSNNFLTEYNAKQNLKLRKRTGQNVQNEPYPWLFYKTFLNFSLYINCPC